MATSRSYFSPGSLALKLAKAFENAGATPDEINAIAEDTEAVDACLNIYRGTHYIVRIVRTVDHGKDPRLPFDGAKVVKHSGEGVALIELRSDDDLYLNGKRIVLHCSERQMGDNRIVGHELRDELESGQQVLLNSNVADYLYEHPELYPEHWKKNEQGENLYIYFWGSVFSDSSGGHLFVSYLYWDDSGLVRVCDSINGNWDCQCFAASVKN